MPTRHGLAHVCLLTTLALGGCATAPPPAEPVARGDQAAVVRQLDAFITAELRRASVAGLSIALVDGERTVWARGFGWADAAAQRPADADTLYRVGSISKLFTATAAMQFVALQRLALDAPVQAVLPAFAVGPANDGDPPPLITPRQLMTHHSGLPRDLLGGMWGVDKADFRGMVADLANDRADAPPDHAFGYSNVGVTVLGAAVERLAGVPFEAHLQRAVLGPLGMDGASFSAAPPAMPAMARGHQKAQPRAEPALRDVPAGGLNASVNGLARFIAMQFAAGRNARGEVVLPAAELAEMQRVQNADVPLDVGFQMGLGWVQTMLGADTVQGGGPVLHHSGATLHFRSQMLLLPQHRLGVVVLANDSAAGELVNRVAQRALALLLEAQADVRQPPPLPGIAPAARPWPEAQQQACVGEYLTPAGVAVLQRDGGRLRARLGDQAFDVVEGEDGWFGLRYRLAGLLPLSLSALDGLGLQCRHVDGHAVLVGRIAGQQMLVGDRLPPPQPVPPALAVLAGRWEPVLAEGEQPTIDRVTLRLDGRRLWVDARLADAFGGQTLPATPLTVLSPTQARVPGLPADSGPRVTLLPPSPAGEDRVRWSGQTFRRVAH